MYLSNRHFAGVRCYAWRMAGNYSRQHSIAQAFADMFSGNSQSFSFVNGSTAAKADIREKMSPACH